METDEKKLPSSEHKDMETDDEKNVPGDSSTPEETRPEDSKKRRERESGEDDGGESETSKPKKPRPGEDIDEEFLEEDEYNTVWEIVEEEEKDGGGSSTGGVKPGSTTTPPEEKDVKVLYFRKIMEGAKLPLFAIPTKTYAPFPHPDIEVAGDYKPEDDTKPVYFMNLETWKTWRRRPWKPEMAVSTGGSIPEKSGVMQMLSHDLKVVRYPFKSVTPGSRSPFSVDYFDERFRLGQELADRLAKDAKTTSQWSAITNQAWEKRNQDDPGEFVFDGEPPNDKRHYVTETTGIFFTRKGKGGDEPSITQRYVKLLSASRKTAYGTVDSDAMKVLRGDTSATGNGVRADEIYIGEDTINALKKEGGYDFDANGQLVLIRNKVGQVQPIQVGEGELRTTTFWTEAYKRGLANADGKRVRSRNVKGLALCFVLTGNRLSVDELKELKNTAIRDAKVAIHQVVNVVERKDHDKKEYNMKLGVSPFGDYETWVSEASYISYLGAYKGYELPDETKLNKMAVKMDEMLRSRKAAAETQAAFNERLKKADTAMRTQVMPLPSEVKEEQGVSLGLVSIQTIREAAGNRGDTSKVKTQGTMMGGSATLIAKEAGWSPYSTTVRGLEAKTITWDSPGVKPSEWLHRSAFSWGTTDGYDLSSSSTNFIFGSSEANSLMTRFEMSWQSLFKNESKFNVKTRDETASTGKRPPLLKGILVTRNTPQDRPILSYAVDAATKVKITKYSNNKGIITKETQDAVLDDKMEVDTPDPKGAKIPDYWAAAVATPNLSFSLEYQLILLSDSKLITGARALPPVVFYPFQRGFFTRIEADVDYLLLSKFLDSAVGSRKVAEPPKLAATVNAIPTIPVAPIEIDKTAPKELPLRINPLTALIVDASSKQPLTLGSPLIVSPLAPSALPHATVWTEVTQGNDITIGGATLSDVKAVTLDYSGRQIHIPLGPTAMNTTEAALGEDGAATVTVIPVSAPLFIPSEATIAQDGLSLPSAVEASSQSAEAVIIPTPVEITNSDNADNVPKGFVLNGSVKLFGLFDEDIYVFYGSASEGMRQIILLKSSLKISDFIPSLAGTEFEALQLQNTQLVFNQLSTVTEEAGTWLQTELVCSGPLQPVSEFLENVCGQDRPFIQVQAFLTAQNDWTAPIPTDSLGLRGILPGMSVKVGDILTITELGVSVGLNRQRDSFPPYKYQWGHTIGFFGKMSIEMPNQQANLPVEFAMIESSGLINVIIDVDDDEMPDAGFAGIDGLRLSQLVMTTTFSIKKAPSLLAFRANAKIYLRETELELSGFYSKEDWGFTCDIYDFDFARLRNMYEDLFDDVLHIADHDILLDNLSLMVGSAGITISGSVTIEGHTSVSATISLDRLGISINGSVDDVRLDGDILLKHAVLNIFIGRKADTTVSGPGTSFKFAITGTVAVANNEVTASLFLGKEKDGKVVWTVIGAFSGAFSLAKIAPPLEGTFLDLSLHNAALIVSNVDGAAVTGAVIPAAYTVVRGVQIAATLAPIAALDSTMGNDTNSPTTGLTLKAVYDADTSAFSLGIELAIPKSMSMQGGSVYSGPISLYVEVSKLPTLVLAADFFVRVPEQEKPLKFTGGVRLGIDAARGFIEMKNQWWENPFGLSPQLRLGPDLALQIGIVYVGPLYPSELGVAAGLAIGSVSGKAALLISETPQNQLIMLEITNLGITDLVSFASLMFQTDLPVPDDFLRFRNLKLYLSTGTTIGTIVYPPGASFSCDAVIFDHQASIYCGVNKATRQIEVKGSVQPIQIGPLSISGTTAGTPAKLALQLGTTTQNLLIDGSISLLDANARVLVRADLIPLPSFSLSTQLAFASHLSFLLEAHMRGPSLSPGGGGAALRAVDFDVHALFKQDVLDYIAAQVNMQILSAKHAVDDGVATAKATLEQAQREFEEGVKAAQAEFDRARDVYEAKVAAVTGALAAERTRSEVEIARLKGNVDAAFRTFDSAVAVAQRELDAANLTRTREIQAAQAKVDKAKADGDQDVDAHLRDLNNARQDMQKRFGSAENDVKRWQAEVQRQQRIVDDARRDADRKKRAVDKAKWYEKLPKGLEYTAAEAKWASLAGGLQTAKGTLSGFQKIITGAGYQTAKALVSTYEQGVEAAKVAAAETLALANATLQTTIRTQDALVAKAKGVLDGVRTSGVEKLAADAAKSALDKYQAAEAAVLVGLQKAVDDLASTAEAIAFGSAELTLKLALANTHDLELAKAAVDLAGQSSKAVLDIGDWVTKHVVDILNVRNVEISGDLRGLCEEGTELKAKVQGSFAGNEVDFSIGFVPGRGQEMVKGVFEKLINDVETGFLSLRD